MKVPEDRGVHRRTELAFTPRGKSSATPAPTTT